jgi:hypothetical protein
MKYNLTSFNLAVSYYKKELIKIKSKNIFIYGIVNQEAFLSIAPLSRACHELDMDMHVSFVDRKISYPLFDIWEACEANNKSLRKFISLAEKKTGPGFNDIFERPDIIIKSDHDGFTGTINLKYSSGWFVKYKWNLLVKTAKLIIKESFAPTKKDIFTVNFELIPKSLDEPMEDYLDSYAIAQSVILQAQKRYSLLRITSSTSRKSMLDKPERISELNTTMLGCEQSKFSHELVFKAFKKLSKELNLSRITPSSAVFGIRGKGYSGKHIFGQKIGYPIPNGKSRWDSPGGFLYKFAWYPQSQYDTRKPKSRTAFTSTVPIDVFIDSVLIDINKMRARNKKIKSIMDKSEKIYVRSNIKYGCNFEVNLIKEDGTRRKVNASDSDARHLIHPEYGKEKKYFGMMANIPGGEAFTTPDYFSGRIVGDVVISLDKSYRLSSSNPLIIDVKKNRYKIISGEKKIIRNLNEKREESWKRINEQEKNKSIPKDIIELKKKNFNGIGEFAINTNPKARLCDYLIVNEKIANMIHVALGSGFEADRATEYHIDMVIDAPRQKLDIYGIDKTGTMLYLLKNGKFVV